MNIKITQDEIMAAVAAAAPEKGQPWDPQAIANSVARMVGSEVDEAREAMDAWQKGREDFAVRFKASDVRMGDAAAVDAMLAKRVAAHKAAVQAKIAKNNAMIDGIAAAAKAAAFTYLGNPAGGFAAIAPQLLTIGNQIAAALNDTN